MIFTIIKNSVLAILIILIIHFIIKNEIVDNIEKMKRITIPSEHVENTLLTNNQQKTLDTISNKKKPSLSEQQINLDNSKEKVYEEKVYEEKECKNSITCDDYKLPEITTDESMKELYEYVFNNEPNKQLDIIYDEKKQEDKIFVDMTEIDQHMKDVSTKHTDENLMCGFEIIGIIDQNDDNDVLGIDMFSQNSVFSKVI